MSVERLAVLEDDAVVAVRVVADDHRRRVDAARRRDGERVHVGDRHRVELAGGVLVDRLDVVVDLHDVDADAVLVGPLLHDAGVGRIGPRHPAGVDRPRERELLLLFRARRAARQQRQHRHRAEQYRQTGSHRVAHRQSSLVWLHGSTAPVGPRVREVHREGVPPSENSSRAFVPPCVRRGRAGSRPSDQSPGM